MKSSSTTDDTVDVTTSDEEDILLNDDPDNGMVPKKPKSTKKKKKTTKKQSNIVGSSMSSSGSSDDNDDSEIVALTKPKSMKKKKKKKTAETSQDGGGGGDDDDEVPPKKPKSTKKKQKKQKVTKDGGGGGGTGGGNSTDDDDDDDEIIAVPSFRKQPSGRGMAAGSSGSSGRGRGGRGPPPMRQGTSYRNNGGGGGGPAPPPSMRGRGMGMGKPQSSSRINGNGGGSGRGRGGGPPPGRGRGRGMPPRMSSAYAAPSSSIHRPPSTRNLPPPPGSASKGNSFALRSMGNSFAVRGSSSRHSGHRPTSILRSSSHHTGSNHAIKKTSIRGQAVRVNVDGTLTSTQSSGRVRTSSNDSFDDSFGDDIEEDDGFYGDDTDEITPVVSRTPSLTIGSLSRSFRNLTDNKGLGAPAPSDDDEGGPIIEGGPGSFDRRTNLSKFKSSQSMRSVLTMDLEFDDETRIIKFLRYIRILAPHPDEKPIKKRIRIITWVALFCDFLAAMVAITTYSGTTYCCGEPILSVAGDFDWDLCIQIVTILYLFLIFLEILPVVRDGFPFNLLNPIVGFLITFAVFFNDRIAEAVIMWIIEAAAVSCETAVYFLRRKAFNERQERLMKTEQQVLELRGVKKRVKKQFESSRHLDLSAMSNHSAMSNNVSSDEDNDMYNSGDSFGDDSSFKDEASIDELTTNTNISNARELRLMRERRLLRQSQAEAERHLHWHLIGVCVNIFLVTLSLALIVSIASSGGLCMVDMTAPNVFDKNPLAKCPACVGYDTSEDGSCQICNDDGTSQCYYAY